MIPHVNVAITVLVSGIVFTDVNRKIYVENREFKKLRRLLQRKHHIKIELCVRLSILQLFHVDHVVQIRRAAL